VPVRLRSHFLAVADDGSDIVHAVRLPLFRSLAVLARAPRNRVRLRAQRLLPTLVLLLRATNAHAARLLGEAARGALDAAASAAVEVLSLYMESELADGGRPLRLASLLLDGEQAAWDAHPACGAADGAHATLSPGTRSAREVHDAGGVAALLSLACRLRAARLVDGAGAQAGLPAEAPALRCLAALLAGATAPACATLRETGGLEALLERVGQAPGGGGDGVGAAGVPCELRAQLLALELAAAAVACDRESLRRAANVGMFSRLSALLRWAGAACSPPLDVSAPPPEPPALTLLFSVLRNLCGGMAEEVGARRALAERTLVAAAVGALHVHPPGAPLRWPALPAAALRFFEALVRSGPLAVAALRSAELEQALLGEAVFFWPGAAAHTGSAQQRHALALALAPPRALLRERAAALLLAMALAPPWTVGGVRVDLGFHPETAALMRAFAVAHAARDAAALTALSCCVQRLAAEAAPRLGAAAVAAGAPDALAPLLLAGVTGEGEAPLRCDAVRDAFAALLRCGPAARLCAAASPQAVAQLLRLAAPPGCEWAAQQLHLLASTPAPPSLPHAKAPLHAALLAALPAAPPAPPRFLALLRACCGCGCGEQEALAAAGAHTQLLCLLTSPGAGADADALAVRCLDTLRAMLARCAPARAQFEAAGGYQRLAAALEASLTRPPSHTLLLGLRALACDGAAEDAGSGVAERAEDTAAPLRFSAALPLLLSLLRRAASEHARGGLQWLAASLEASASAQCAAASANLPSLLLAWLQQEQAASGDCLTRQLGACLAACHSVSCSDVRALLSLARRSPPSVRRLLVESLCGAASADDEQPRAFFFLPGTPGGGLQLLPPLAWPSGRSLTFAVALCGDALPSCGAEGCALLSLRTECGGGLLLSVAQDGAQLSLWAPGAAPGAAPAQHARLPAQLQAGRWTRLALSLSAGGLGPLGGGAHRLRLFLDGAEVDAQRIRCPRFQQGAALTRCGVGCAPPPPGWEGSPCAPPFRGCLAQPRLFHEALRPAQLLEGEGEWGEGLPSCVLALSAAATDGTAQEPGGDGDAHPPHLRCSNVAPCRAAPLAAAALAGESTCVCVLRTVAEALRTLGGAAVLLPLVEDGDGEVAAAAVKLLARAVSPQLLDLHLLTATLRRRAQRAMATPALLAACCALAEAQGAGAAVARAALVLDVHLWGCCAGDQARVAQAALLAVVTGEAPGEARAAAAPCAIADCLVAWGGSPEVRAALLDAARAHLRAPGAPQHATKDVRALLGLTLGGVGDECAAEAARALASALAEPGSQALAEAAAAAGGPALALEAAGAAHPALRCAAVRLATALLAHPGSPTAPPPDAPALLSALAEALAPHPLCAEGADALLGLAVGGQWVGGEWEGGAAPALAHPAALALLLRLLPTCPDSRARCAALRAALALVEGSVGNAAACAAQPDWQTWLLPLLAPAQPGGDVDEGEALQLSRGLCAALHAHCLLRFGGPGGGEQLQRSASFAALHAGAAGETCGAAAQSALCEAVSDALCRALQPCERWGPSAAPCLLSALAVVDELLPDAASLLPAQPGAQGEGPQAPPQALWRMCCAAARALHRLWPVLQAEAAAAAQPPGQPHAAPSPSLRQRAVSLLLWTGGGAEAAAASAAAIASAARLTLRLCLLAARAMPVEQASSCLALLQPLLPCALSCWQGDGDQLLCSAAAQCARAAALEAQQAPQCCERLGRAALAEALLLAAALAAGYLPAPARAQGDGEGRAVAPPPGAQQALAQVLSERLSQPRLVAASELEAQALRAATQRRREAVRELREELATAREAAARAAQAVRQAGAAAAQALRDGEQARRTAAAALADEAAAAAQRRLRHALRTVSGERGVWGCEKAAAAVHWKVDRAEDPLRRRLRLRRDYRHGTYDDGAAQQAAGMPAPAADAQALAAAAAAAGAVQPAGWQDQQEREREQAQGEEPPLAPLFAAPLEPHEPAFSERETPGPAPSGDELLWSTACSLVTVQRTLPGTLHIHRGVVHFAADAAAQGGPEGGPRPARCHWRWPTQRLQSVHCQRYLLQARGLELFLEDRSSAFLALPHRAAMLRCCAALVRARPGLLLLDRRRKAEAAGRAQERWRRRDLSSFEYLMTLNTLAGRSYNDLAQYPVMPWVIADYKSAVLELGGKGVLRDLSRPVGALNPSLRPALVERYAALAGGEGGAGCSALPPFHHGTHYSTPGGVLHWLLRLQPFTALHRQLQGGRFDHADRLFHSVPAAWAGAWGNAADCRELTPEWFCAPEFLLNGECHSLGTRQDGQRVGCVALPPWARGDAASLVRAHAAALECDAVSAQLHGWVDLVFGCAQRGAGAVGALNVFYHLTYEGAVDLERVQDAHTRAALADQIALFGQTPQQLFTRPGRARDAPLRRAPALHCSQAALWWGAPQQHSAALQLLAEAGCAGGGGAVLLVAEWAEGRVVCLAKDGQLALHSLIRPLHAAAGGAFTFAAGGAAGGAGDGGYFLGPPPFGEAEAAGPPCLPPFAAQLPLSPACFAVLPQPQPLLFSAPHWDGRLHCLRPGCAREAQALRAHADLVSCVAAVGRTVVSGSRDTTLCVWQLATPPAAQPLAAQPRCVLAGHEASVSCVCVSEALDCVASASQGDGLLLLFALRSGRHMRTIPLPPDTAPALALLSDAAGALVLLLQARDGASQLRSFNVNGMPLGAALADEQVGTMALTRDGTGLLTGGEQGAICLRDVASLRLLRRWGGAGGAAITALCVVADDALLAGTQDGNIQLWGPPVEDS